MTTQGAPEAGAIELLPCNASRTSTPSSHECPNMKEVGGGFEGERYRCAVCGKSYFLDYEDMK